MQKKMNKSVIQAYAIVNGIGGKYVFDYDSMNGYPFFRLRKGEESFVDGLVIGADRDYIGLIRSAHANNSDFIIELKLEGRLYKLEDEQMSDIAKRIRLARVMNNPAFVSRMGVHLEEDLGLLKKIEEELFAKKLFK